MVELHNGCICCTLRGDLLKTVKSLAEENKYDYLVIESTGISEPLPVAQTFVMNVDETEDGQLVVADEASEASLSNYAKLDTMVTVVDALNLFDVLSSIEKLSEKNSSGMVGNTGIEDDSKMEMDEEAPVDDRSVAQLMLDQIEFANVIVISKCQILLEREKGDKTKLESIKGLLKKLNPNAKILAPMNFYEDLNARKELLQTGMFDLEKSQTEPGWILELQTPHTSETEEYGIGSTVFRSNRMPFHPQRFFDILEGFGNYASALSSEAGSTKEKVFKGVVRTKGRVWLANANAFPLDIHTAGKHLGIEPYPKPFLAAEDKSMWDEDDCAEYDEAVEKGEWSKDFGDRSSEIVFIGIGLDKKKIHERLEEALLTEEESKKLGGMSGWKKLPDPFFGGAAVENWFEVSYVEEGDLKVDVHHHH